MSAERPIATASYECERVGDVYVLPNGQFRLVAEGARWTDGPGTEIKATIGVFAGEVLISQVGVNLNSLASKKRFIKELQAEKNVAIPDSALVTLESAIRRDLPRAKSASTSPGNGLAHSHPSGEVVLTEAVKAFGSDPALLEQLAQAIRMAGGWAGDVRPPLLGYVAMTSCLLVEPERPMNLAFVSQAGTGKNKAVDSARVVIPEERCFVQRAGSEKSLIYVDEPFQYRVVIFAEADSIPDEGPAASAIRSLASDNIFAYDVPEQNPETNKFETRRISKPGPTGLITTSTRSLQHQLGTRVLEVHLHDDPVQTARVIDVQALECDGTSPPAFDVAPFLDYQRWLSATAPHRVVVPFARALGTLVPTVSVRMRRDFPQLLSCIRTIALLRVLQRERSPDGAVVATLEDYAAARDLLVPIFDSLATEGLTPAIRDTVDAVGLFGAEVSLSMLQTRLKVAKSTVKWRVDRAIKAGWLKNLETRRGSPARLVCGEPLPDDASALPTVQRVREAFESSRTPTRTVLNDSDSNTSSEVFECASRIPERSSQLLDHDGGAHERFS